MDNTTTLPAPGVLSITGERTELVVWESVVKVTVVGVVEHGFDALPEKRLSNKQKVNMNNAHSTNNYRSE